MALHGQISVNSSILAEWAAQRVVTGDQGTHTYACEVHWVTDSGQDITKRFEISHREADGPIALASKVLTRADAVSRWRR